MINPYTGEQIKPLIDRVHETISKGDRNDNSFSVMCKQERIDNWAPKKALVNLGFLKAAHGVVNWRWTNGRPVGEDLDKIAAEMTRLADEKAEQLRQKIIANGAKKKDTRPAPASQAALPLEPYRHAKELTEINERLDIISSDQTEIRRMVNALLAEWGVAAPAN